MSSLRDIKESENTYLFYSDSSQAEIYVYDKIKAMCKAPLECIYTVDSASKFNEMLELVGVDPYLAEKWFFVIEYQKVKGKLKNQSGLFKVENSMFLVKVKNYREFKEFKEFCPTCVDLYLSVLKKSDSMLLLSDFSLSPKLVSFVATSYARDPDKVFELRSKLLNGYKIESQKDVVRLLGVSSGSISSFAMSLLKDPPKSDRGKKTVYRLRIQTAKSFIDTYGVYSFRNFLRSCVRDILKIKVLYMQGLIYQAIRDLPEGYDEKKLSRYNYYLDRIVSTPYNRILKLYLILDEDKWKTEADCIGAIYKYYN